MSVEQLKIDAIDAAQKYKARYKQTLDPNDLDMFKRFMDVYNHLDGMGGGVTSIIAGNNISISPAGGTGDVTINATAFVPDPTGYGSFYSDQTQPLLAIDTPQVVAFNNTYEGNEVYISSDRIYFNKSGTYQFCYIAQIFNISNDVQHCEFWIKYNGVDFPNSATHITVNPRKSSGEPSEQQMTLTLTGTAQNDGDYIELYWQGSSIELELGYIAGGTGDGPVSSPSVIANIIPVGTGGIEYALRHDFVSPYSYCGKALANSLETENVWTINRIEVFDDGTTTITSATNVDWTNRYTHTYS